MRNSDRELRARLRRIIREEVEATAPRARLLNQRSRRWLREDANPDKIDFERFPLELSKASADPDMKSKVTQGTEDKNAKDDIVKVTLVNIPVNKLKPSQSTMKVSNAVGMALGMLVKGKAGGDLGAFISSDNFIMDGHHRWIATYMVDPSASVGGKKVSLPGKQLVAVLNAITAGKLGKAGNKGSGSFDDFKKKDKIVEQIEKIGKDGVPDVDKDGKIKGYFTTPEDAQKIIEEKGGAAELADFFIKNLSTATLSTPEWAVPRIEMPVIDTGKPAETAVKALTGGEVDLNPPYASGGGEKKDEKEKQNAGRERQGTVVVERWQRLAGIIK